jgi:acyl homoserine lactone synthase
MTIRAIQEVMRFAQRMGITRYVTVTTTPIERMLRRAGLDISRLGAPLQIGDERAVALDVAVSAKTLTSLFGPVAAAA